MLTTKDKEVMYQHRYYLSHKDYLQYKKKLNYFENIERYRSYGKQWYKDNAEKIINDPEYKQAYMEKYKRNKN